MQKKRFCHSFINCGFKGQSADASCCAMHEKSSATQGMCPVSDSCICFKLWLVYNHYHTEALQNSKHPKTPKSLIADDLRIAGPSMYSNLMVFYLFVDRVSSSRWPIKLHLNSLLQCIINFLT